jgi:hypothetical protein
MTDVMTESQHSFDIAYVTDASVTDVTDAYARVCETYDMRM